MRNTNESRVIVDSWTRIWLAYFLWGICRTILTFFQGFDLFIRERSAISLQFPFELLSELGFVWQIPCYRGFALAVRLTFFPFMARSSLLAVLLFYKGMGYADWSISQLGSTNDLIIDNNAASEPWTAVVHSPPLCLLKLSFICRSPILQSSSVLIPSAADIRFRVSVCPLL